MVRWNKIHDPNLVVSIVVLRVLCDPELLGHEVHQEKYMR